jgi:hypothetical protein
MAWVVSSGEAWGLRGAGEGREQGGGKEGTGLLVKPMTPTQGSGIHEGV